MFTRKAIALSVAGVALIGVSLIAALPGGPKPKSPEMPTAIVQRSSFEVSVNTVGTLDAARSYVVSSEIRGDKGKIIYLIEDGSQVQKGDILVRLDPTPFDDEVYRLMGEISALEAAADAQRQIFEWEKNQVEKEVKTAEFNLKVAKLDLNRLVNGEGPLELSQMKGDVEKVREELARFTSYIEALEQLKQEGFSNPTELSSGREKTADLKKELNLLEKKYNTFEKEVFPARIETARARVGQAEMELEQTRTGSVYKLAKTSSVIREVESRLENVRTSLKSAQAELEKTSISAPFPGISVLYETFRDGQRRKPRIGDKVLQNQPLLYLPDIAAMIVKTQVREIDLHKISIGMPCAVKVDAYPEDRFRGEVTFIGILASDRPADSSAEKYFDLTIALKDSDTRLRPGMTARVSIESSRVENALCVPLHAVFSEADEKYCYVYRDAGFAKVKVATGRMNNNLIVIKKGLAEGDMVSLVKPNS